MKNLKNDCLSIENNAVKFLYQIRAKNTRTNSIIP